MVAGGLYDWFFGDDGILICKKNSRSDMLRLVNSVYCFFMLQVFIPKMEYNGQNAIAPVSKGTTASNPHQLLK
jgi:hypothetical protein